MSSIASVPATGTMSKANLRSAALTRRKGLAHVEPDAVHQVMDHVSQLLVGKTQNIAGYLAIGCELDLETTLKSLHERGNTICLPVNAAEPSPMTFRVWVPGIKLMKGPNGTTMPTSRADEVAPDVVLVPLVAFDRLGHRLGYGKGFYDRTLQDLRKRKNIAVYGIGYDGQEVEAIPTEEHDEPLDGVITPTRIILSTKDQ